MGRIWTEKEKSVAIRMTKQGHTSYEIAQALGRSRYAIDQFRTKNHLRATRYKARACRHCKATKKKHKAHGLCRRCYHVPELREKYRRKTTPLITCRDCGEQKHERLRGLCNSCYERQKAEHPELFRGGFRGLGLETPARMPPEPTDTQPGTPERAEVYGQRLANGFHLYHPEDRKEQ